MSGVLCRVVCVCGLKSDLSNHLLKIRQMKPPTAVKYSDHLTECDYYGSSSGNQITQKRRGGVAATSHANLGRFFVLNTLRVVTL